MVKRPPHRFIVRLKNSGKYSGRDAQHVLARARELVAELPIFMGVARVARNVVEFDVHASSQDAVERWAREAITLGPVEEIRFLDPTLPPEPKERAIARGREFFNAERFWEAHEVWEGAWKQSRGPEREALQALILVAAAFVHEQRGRNQVARGILQRARRILHGHHGRIGDIELRAAAQHVESLLRAGTLAPFTL